MAIVVLLILVVVWAAVLGPGFLRRRFERRSSDSIGAFHHHLRVLERTAPTSVDATPGRFPAHRGVRQVRHELRPDVPLAPVAGRGHPDLTLVPPGRFSPPGGFSTPGGVHRARHRADPFFSPAACRRRRDVLLCLSCAVLGTALVGAIPPLRMALVLTGVAALVTGLYVVLLVRMRARAVERASKLRYLPERAEPPTTFVIRQRAAR